jgi:hypothetical protein
MTVNKLSVVVGAGGCEDGVNMVRVKGQVNSIKVSNTVSDAVDIDFSEITFDEIDVKNTDNDCIDLSAGKYLIKSVNAHNCGDKGISIGEGARLHVERAQIEKAVIGVAVKDSSQVSITKLQVRGAKTCVAAYRKKQEFSGGIARITETTCNGGAIHADFGSAVVARGTP